MSKDQVTCPQCGGYGAVVYTASHPECCGNFLRSGECCGNAVEGQHEEQAPCDQCRGHGWVDRDPKSNEVGE